MKETRMAATSNYGFNQIDCTQDPEMLFQEYVQKDSKENWQKADTIIKNVEDKVEQVNGALEKLDAKDTEQDNRLAELENTPKSNVTLNGEAQTNFNFIENEVVQDGLINSIEKEDLKIASNITTINPSVNQTTMVLKLKLNSLTTLGDGGWFAMFYADEGANKYQGEFRIVNGKFYCYFGGTYAFKNSLNLGNNYICFSTNSKETIISCNGETIVGKSKENFTLSSLRLGKVLNNVEVDGSCKCFIYGNNLTPQEIQHNFSVLNTTPAIKELHATDADGKTSILKFSSDTDHVVDRLGRTQEQINKTFYKRMCKEIPSTNGEPITVNNGEEGYVLSAEIKGQTVKNEVTDIEMLTTTQWDTTTRIEYISDGWFRTYRNGSDTFVGRKTTTINTADLKNMTLIMEIRKNTLTADCVLSGGRFGKAPKAGETGIFKIPYVSNGTDTHLNYFILKGDGEIEFRYTLVKTEEPDQ